MHIILILEIRYIQMEELLTCKYLNCNKFFHIPIRLPCDNTLCQSHIKELYEDKENMSSIRCYFCNSVHSLSENDGYFPINYDLKKLLDLNLHLSEKHKNVKILNEKLDKLTNEIKCVKTQPDLFVYDYFAELRKKIDIHREKLKYEIDQISEEMIDKLKLLENECNSNLKEHVEIFNDKIEKKENNQFIDEIRKPNLNEEKLNELYEEINKCINENETLFEILKNKLLNEKSIEFKPSLIIDNKHDLFGQLNIKTTITKDETPINNSISQNLDGHSSNVSTMKIIAKNKHLITGSADYTIKIWDIDAGVCLKTLKSHTDELSCLKYLNENLLVSGSWDFNIKLWNIQTSTCTKTLYGHTDCITVIRFDSDKRNLISGSLDGTIKIWEVDSGVCLKTLTEHKNGVIALKLTNGGILISGSIDNSIKLWDIEKGVCIISLRGHSSSVECLKLLNNGKLVSGSLDCTIKIWDINKVSCIKTLVGHLDRIGHLKVIQDKQLLISGSDDNTIKIWNMDRNVCVATLRGHSDRIECLKIFKNTHLISSSWDCLIKIWDIKDTFVCLNTLKGHSGIVRRLILVDNNRLISGSDDNTIKIWKIKLI